MRRCSVGVLATIACAALPVHGQVADPAAGKAPPWQVDDPPGESSSVAIDTTQTTWSDVDVSPDGRTIVFDMLGDLYAVSIEGGEARALTDGIAWDFQPRFSPDGRHIAFISDRAGADNIWVMRADGSAAKAITAEREYPVHNPAWSPDGQYLAARKGFMSERAVDAGEIWLFNTGGGEGLPLVERRDGKRAQKNTAEPAFSRDGRYVYFSQDDTPGIEWQYDTNAVGAIFAIKRLDRVTGEVEVIAAGPGGALRPTPAPDGKRLAFVKRTPRHTSALYIKDLVSGKEWPIYEQLDRDLQEAVGSTGVTPALAWTPDGAAIVFWASGHFFRIDVHSKHATLIPVRVRTQRQVAPALRFAHAVAPESFDVKMIRWAQYSPDGKSVVFQALGHLYVRDVASGRQRRLTTQSDHFELFPSFSRDGRQIVYATWDDQRLGSIRTIRVNGGRPRIVTQVPGHYVEPRFSPDGRTIVFRRITGGYLTSGLWSPDPGIYVVPAAGGPARRVTKPGVNAHFGASSDRIYFATRDEDGVQFSFKSATLEGHDQRVHLRGNDVTEFSVSPDGRWVGFVQQFNAYIAPFATTGKTVEISARATSLPVRRVSQRAGELLHWSSDAQRLHWAHGSTLFTRELRDAFAALDGSVSQLPAPVETGLSLGFKAKTDVPAGVIALTGARIVTMRDAATTQEVIEHGVVVVRGNRIERVGATESVDIPQDARVIDVSGSTIVPGLVDVHAHSLVSNEGIIPQQNWLQYSNLSFGVTTIHDPSNETNSIFAAAELQRAGVVLAPRIYSTGRILYAGYYAGDTVKIDSYEDALFHVRRLKDAGALSVKSYQYRRREQRQQVIGAARELGMMVMPEGGAHFHANMSQIVDGHTGIEHSLALANAYDDVRQLWSQTKVGYTPTLGVAYGGLAGERYWYDRTNVWEDDKLQRFTPRFIVEPVAMRRLKAPDFHYNHVHVARLARELMTRGVSVQIGAHGQREGLAAHWELWMLEQGGFTPWEALRAATIDGARYIGLDGDIGSIERGKLADLVVIDGNPLAKLRDSRRVSRVMLNGRLYDASTLNQLAPDARSRRPFFFEVEGGDTLPAATRTRIDELRDHYGWRH